MTVEAETVLQPSLHTTEEFARMVLDECDCRNIDVQDLYDRCDELDAFGEPDLGGGYGDVIDFATERLTDAGYANVFAEDAFLIWPKGADIPEEWRCT